MLRSRQKKARAPVESVRRGKDTRPRTAAAGLCARVQHRPASWVNRPHQRTENLHTRTKARREKQATARTKTRGRAPPPNPYPTNPETDKSNGNSKRPLGVCHPRGPRSLPPAFSPPAQPWPVKRAARQNKSARPQRPKPLCELRSHKAATSADSNCTNRLLPLP